jgi:hypothetical protein
MPEQANQQELDPIQQAYLGTMRFIKKAKEEAVKRYGREAVFGQRGELRNYFQSKIMLGPRRSHELLFSQHQERFHLLVTSSVDVKPLEYSQFVKNLGQYSRVEFILSPEGLSISGTTWAGGEEETLEPAADAVEHVVNLFHLAVLEGRYLPKLKDLPAGS